MSNTIKVEFNRAFWKVFLLIFSAVLISTYVDQLLNRQIDSIIRSPQGLSNSIWFWGACSLLSSLFFPLVISLFCSQTLANAHGSYRKIFSNKFELAVIETLRSWGKTFLWCFVFILPGLYFFAFYILVPYIVYFSKKYEAGEVDALKYAVQLGRKFFWRLQWWLTVFYFCIPFATSTLFDEYKLFNVHPTAAIFCVLLETVIILAFNYVMLKSLFKYLNEVEHAPAI